METITFSGLSKSYGRVPVLRQVSATIGAGQVVGLFGRNGVGKTTLMRILYGMIAPDAGSAALLGLDPQTNPVEVRQRVALVSEECHLYPWMDATTLEAFLAPLYPKWDGALFRQHLAGLEVPADRRVDALSRGTKRKLMLALALASQPEVLLLDEPLGGLDAVVREQIVTTLIQSLTDRGVTIFLSTHEIEQFAKVCDRVIILSHGSFLVDRETADLTAQVRRITATLEHPVEAVPAHPKILSARVHGTQVEFILDGYTPELVTAILANYKVREHAVTGLTLPEIFITFTSKDTGR
ncbi:MAG: ABC transporter, ATP-binding protein [Candidatus Ozemobacter sibiricus]|jgi:ABC-2 type transport system ATP-binding protein|uniref:ABC transporter, ATP-binding protein n=1 Tax=Candidatus Ozemobacter sibiricus TaxID=2268124 RepID=A0A367ZIU0_9BACT|nr:MAG: ABC transporter, ATP-binding protein [Candidatus Ozemobacter sibiricus]